MKVWALNLAVAAAATGLMLYVAEAFLRVSAPTDPALAAMRVAEEAGRPFDRRSRMEVVRDLRAEGVDAVPRIIPAALLEDAGDGTLRSRLSLDGNELLPLAGISRKQVVLCAELGHYALYESDEHGFRNPSGRWARAPVDLVLLGDSFTLGECVDPGDDLGALLREHVPSTVNLGMGGHGPLLQLATLREYGRLLEPRVVLWVYFENDLWWFDLLRERRSPLLRRYLDPEFRQGLADLQPEIDRELAEVVEAGGEHPEGEPSPAVRLEQRRGTWVSRLGDALVLQRLRTLIGRLRGTGVQPWEKQPADFELFERILRLAREETAQWDGRIHFVYLPGVWSFEPGSPDDPHRDRVLGLAEELGFPVVDVEAAAAAHPDPLSLYSFRGGSQIGPPHFGPEGYRLAAETILAHLRRHGVVGEATARAAR